MCNNSNNWESSCCKKEKDLDVRHLKAKDIKTCCLRSKDIVVDDLCAQSVSAKSSMSESANINELCARSANINDLCVDRLNVANFNACTNYRASIGFAAASTPYNLSTPINFTTIFDDPNNSIAFGPTRYIAPVSGYYIASLTLSVKNLQGATTIAGTPTAQMDILVNGIKIKAGFTPFLTFFPAQEGLLSSLLRLNAGDVVTWGYEVLVIDAVSGLSSYVGTVDLVGGAVSSGVVSSFQILHQSSIDCIPAPGTSCVQCPLVEVPCEPMEHGCEDSPCSGSGSVRASLRNAPLVVSNCKRADGSCPTPAASVADRRRR